MIACGVLNRMREVRPAAVLPRPLSAVFMGRVRELLDSRNNPKAGQGVARGAHRATRLNGSRAALKCLNLNELHSELSNDNILIFNDLDWVVYQLAADKYFRPLASRLSGVHQPFVRSQIGFSASC
jgi:hypothetical protein